MIDQFLEANFLTDYEGDPLFDILEAGNKSWKNLDAPSFTKSGSPVFVDISSNTNLTVAARITLTGDQLDLATTGVSAGTYPVVTTDVYGRITAGRALLDSDVPDALTIDGGTINNTPIGVNTQHEAHVTTFEATGASTLRANVDLTFTGDPILRITGYGAGTGHGRLHTRGAGGTIDLPTAISVGVHIGRWATWGYDGDQFIRSISQSAVVTAVADNAIESKWTWTRGATDPEDIMMELDWSGNLSVGGTIIAGSGGLVLPADVLVDADIGSTVQAYDATLTALAGVTTAADKLIYWTDVDVAAATDFTALGRALVALSTLASNGVVYGQGSGAPAATAQGAANTVLTGTGAAPAFSGSPRVDRLAVGGAFIDANGAASITKIHTDPSAVISGLEAWNSLTIGANNSSGQYGIYGQTRLVGSTFNHTGTLRGVFGVGRFVSGSGTASAIVGVDGLAQNTAAGTITSAVAISASGNLNSGGGTIGTSTGIQVSDQSVGTNNRGLWLRQSTIGTNNFALYQDSASVKSYFNGFVGFGTTAADVPLHVVGASKLLGAVTIGNASTDLITSAGRLSLRGIAGISTIPGTLGEIVRNTSDGDKPYWCQAGHATAATWKKVLTEADIPAVTGAVQNLHSYGTSASTTATSKTTLAGHTYTMPVSTLAATGDRLEIEAFIQLKSEIAQTSRIYLDFGGQTIIDYTHGGGGTAQQGQMRLRCTIIRLSTNTQQISWSLVPSGVTSGTFTGQGGTVSGTQTLDSGTLAVTLSGLVSVTTGTDNQVTCYHSTVTYHKFA